MKLILLLLIVFCFWPKTLWADGDTLKYDDGNMC